MRFRYLYRHKNDRVFVLEVVHLLYQKEDTEVGEKLSIYEERGMVKGRRKALLRQMQTKFGELPEQVEARLRSITDETQLDTLLDRILTAETLADMKLEEV